MKKKNILHENHFIKLYILEVESFFIHKYHPNRKSEANEIIPFRSSPVIVGGRGFWRLGSVPDPGGLVDWGQGEFVYGRQYAVSAIIAHSENCTEFFRN